MKIYIEVKSKKLALTVSKTDTILTLKPKIMDLCAQHKVKVKGDLLSMEIFWNSNGEDKSVVSSEYKKPLPAIGITENDTLKFMVPNLRKTLTALLPQAVEQADMHYTIALLQGGADVNYQNQSKDPVLLLPFYTCYKFPKESEQMIKILINYHAKVNIRDRAGETVLVQFVREYIVRNGKDIVTSLDIFWLLLKNGADPNVVTKNGFTALAIAVAAGSKPCIQALMEAGADLNSHLNLRRVAQPNTPSLLYVFKNPEIAESLVKRGALVPDTISELEKINPEWDDDYGKDYKLEDCKSKGQERLDKLKGIYMKQFIVPIVLELGNGDLLKDLKPGDADAERQFQKTQLLLAAEHREALLKPLKKSALAISAPINLNNLVENFYSILMSSQIFLKADIEAYWDRHVTKVLEEYQTASDQKDSESLKEYPLIPSTESGYSYNPELLEEIRDLCDESDDDLDDEQDGDFGLSLNHHYNSPWGISPRPSDALTSLSSSHSSSLFSESFSCTSSSSSHSSGSSSSSSKTIVGDHHDAQKEVAIRIAHRTEQIQILQKRLLENFVLKTQDQFPVEKYLEYLEAHLDRLYRTIGEEAHQTIEEIEAEFQAFVITASPSLTL